MRNVIIIIRICKREKLEEKFVKEKIETIVSTTDKQGLEESKLAKMVTGGQECFIVQ